MSDYVPSSSASSSRARKYDVFLSFRGEDTRRIFVNHLYNALEQKRIHVFKDDERLEVGKTISNELMKVIQESRFAVVVFSKNFASSKWCLEELAHIIKCKNDLDLNVIPVFYDVNPSDVRHQHSPFAKSFSKHERKCKDDMEKVQRWRDAFVEAGNLSGYHLPNFKDEADCIKNLVDDIFPKWLKVISLFPENFVGTQIEKVMPLLHLDSNHDVRSIGIWGMGGIGKTEIATCLHQRYRYKFEVDCFLGDVGPLCQENGLRCLAQLLICKLLDKTITLTCEYEGVTIIKNILRGKKVLLILDNVSHQEQLECLVGDPDPEWFGRGSRIIITARDKRPIISHVGDNVYEVQLLTESEALELFSRYAFKEKSPKEDFMELSRQVVQYAGRLPLALKVLGSFFYGRDREQYVDIIDRLMKIPHKDILAKLRISFDGLEKDVKEIFLDIACFYNKVSDYYVKLVLQSRGIKWIVINFLVDKSLLSIRDGYRLEMHNLLSEMGENISREEYTNSRIWQNEEVHDLFAGNLKTTKVESLWIQENYEFEDDPVKISKVFKRMKSLQVLRIEDETFSSNCTVTHLPSSLRFVDWIRYPSSSLPESFEPSQLVVLILRTSLLVELFPIPKKLSNLKHLDLSKCLHLIKTPYFGDIPNLEKLILQWCKNLEEVHPSLGHCRMLKKLDLEGCTKLQKLPKSVSMLSLQILNLRECTSLKKFPKISRSMQSLSKLLVGSPWIRSLPSNLGDLTSLELLNCEVLESIPDTIVQNLKCLRIEGCNKLAMLPQSLEVQSELAWLTIIDCENLKKLPNSIQMESLQFLYISNCPKLDTFPEINGDMQRLSYLTLHSTAINGELTSSIGNLSGLTHLNLDGCKDLVSLPNSICNLKNLRWLCVNDCKKLEKLPENIGDFQHLKELKVSGSNILCLPKSISKLLNLRSLDVQFCTSLSELPGELPPNLTNLYADDHLGLKSIRDLLVKCVMLGEISFSESKNVHWVPASTNQNLLKFLGHFLRTFIQCHFHRRLYFRISFPIGGRIAESRGCNFSINLKQSWYTNNFKGFLICYCGDKGFSSLTCQLSDPGRKHTLGCFVSPYTVPHGPFLSITYIPYTSFHLAYHCKVRKNPNDYSLFEVSTLEIGACWRFYLVYENKGEIGFSGEFVPLEPSYASNHLQAYDEHNTATDMVLHLGYEIEADLEVNQKEHETQNVELIRVCDDSRMRKRKRRNNRKKIIKEAST